MCTFIFLILSALATEPQDSHALPPADPMAMPGCDDAFQGVPTGVFTLWKPTGCHKIPFFVEVRNETDWCVSPEFSNIPDPIVVDSTGMMVGAITDEDAFVSCIPPHTRVWVIAPSPDITVTGVTRATSSSWHSAHMTEVNGVPVRALNIVTPEGSLPSRKVSTCRARTWKTESPGQFTTPGEHIPVIKFDGQFCSP